MFIRIVPKGATPLVWDLSQGPCRIGREAANELVVCEDGISRFHAELRQEGKSVILSDAGSSNGVFIDGDRVKRPTVIMPGERFTLCRNAATVWFETITNSSVVIRRRPPTRGASSSSATSVCCY